MTSRNRLRAGENRRSRALGAFLLAAPFLLTGAGLARAEPTAEPAPAPAPDLWSRPALLGDMGGLRPWLERHGITLGLTETSEIFGNASGGLKRGTAYDGMTNLSLDIDGGKALGIPGGTLHVSLLQIHGRQISSDNLAVLQTASNIEAKDSTRLWEAWYQQSFLDNALDLRLGQQSIDQEFMTSQYGGLFLNAAMGWAALPAADLFAGGPAYPLSSPGIRLRAAPAKDVTVLAGIFDDNPPGGTFADDSQLRGAERFGTKFNLDHGALLIGELQYSLNPAPTGGDGLAQGLPGTYKIGFWYDTARFPDQRFDSNGLSLANPASTGVARADRGNFSLYALADQMIWRPDPKGARALGLFARVMGAPNDRNLVSFSADAGFNLKAPLPGRDDDSFGIGVGYARISPAATDLDRDSNRFADADDPVRHGETFIEATYQFQAAPWWQIQPDFQYVFSPGGGIRDQSEASGRIKNEAIFGLRTLITF